MLSLDELAYVDNIQVADLSALQSPQRQQNLEQTCLNEKNSGSSGGGSQGRPAAYNSVQLLSAPLVRSKWGGALIQVSPWIRGGPDAPHPQTAVFLAHYFPALTHLTLNCQELPRGLLSELAATHPYLQVLDLGQACNVSASDLVKALPSWQQLCRLSLAGIQVTTRGQSTSSPGPAATCAALLSAAAFDVEVAPSCPWHSILPQGIGSGRAVGSPVTRDILGALVKLPRLTSLDVSLRVVYAPGAATWSGRRQGLPIFQECEALTRLTALTELHIGCNRLSSQVWLERPGSVAPVCSNQYSTSCSQMLWLTEAHDVYCT